MANIQKLLCDHLRRQLSAPTITAVQIPAGGDLLWQWFRELHAGRTFGFSGPNPISHAEILSYGQVMRWPIEPRHVSILRALDAVYLDHAYSKQQQAASGVKTAQPISNTKMTAGMFDAMFG